MQSIWETKFVVVDVETTGSKPEYNNVIEISCILVKNGEILEEFSTLVNPHQNIPKFITQMTGITNEMTYNAPDFRVIIPELKRFFTKDSVFVAHNVNFDYSFVQKSFEKNGFEFPEIAKLCTLRLARRLIGGINKKNVGALSEYLGIRIKNRHRAFGDSRATAQILIELLEIAENEHNITETEDLLQFQYKPYFSYNVAQKILGKPYFESEELPDSPGVYYFIDDNENVLYIGKAKSLRKRIQSYFTTTTSRKIIRLLRATKKIRWQTTSTELRALIEESRQIKLYKPEFNVVSKRLRSFPFIQVSNEKRYPVFNITYEPNPNEGICFGPFKNRETAELVLDIIYKKFRLKKCKSEFDRKHPETTCLYFQTKKCLAPCLEDFQDEEYYDELNRVRDFLTNVDNGLIQTLESLMFSYADNFDFEQANEIKNQIYEVRKVFGNDLENFAQLSERNFLAIYPRNGNYSGVEVLLIHNGKLVWDAYLNEYPSFEFLLEKVSKFLEKNWNIDGKLSKEEMDEIRIVMNWINQHRYDLKILDVGKLLESKS
jgi:DNA polymerase-3 subunit epsilon